MNLRFKMIYINEGILYERKQLWNNNENINESSSGQYVENRNERQRNKTRLDSNAEISSERGNGIDYRENREQENKNTKAGIQIHERNNEEVLQTIPKNKLD